MREETRAGGEGVLARSGNVRFFYENKTYVYRISQFAAGVGEISDIPGSHESLPSSQQPSLECIEYGNPAFEGQ